MPVHIGGAKSFKQRVTGDIVSSYQWVNDEPAMILWPKIPKVKGGAFAICLSSAFKYSDVPYLIEQAKTAAEVMGMDQSAYTVRRIADVILDGLPDLIEMPPYLKAEADSLVEDAVKQTIGELAIKVDGQTVHEQEVSAP